MITVPVPKEVLEPFVDDGGCLTDAGRDLMTDRGYDREGTVQNRLKEDVLKAVWLRGGQQLLHFTRESRMGGHEALRWLHSKGLHLNLEQSETVQSVPDTELQTLADRMIRLSGIVLNHIEAIVESGDVKASTLSAMLPRLVGLSIVIKGVQTKARRAASAKNREPDADLAQVAMQIERLQKQLDSFHDNQDGPLRLARPPASKSNGS